ncbi:MAG TPA: hypothetical protein VNG29_03080 [Candidatus Paceibacterota bacterium]|nr:hypothetical protein [Candidatus Paceibacterota bacterium]
MPYRIFAVIGILCLASAASVLLLALHGARIVLFNKRKPSGDSFVGACKGLGIALVYSIALYLAIPALLLHNEIRTRRVLRKLRKANTNSAFANALRRGVAMSVNTETGEVVYYDLKTLEDELCPGPELSADLPLRTSENPEPGMAQLADDLGL